MKKGSKKLFCVHTLKSGFDHVSYRAVALIVVDAFSVLLVDTLSFEWFCRFGNGFCPARRLGLGRKQIVRRDKVFQHPEEKNCRIKEKQNTSILNEPPGSLVRQKDLFCRY
jgi:hypothetical protein